MNESAGQGAQRTASGGIVLRPGEGRTIPGTDAIALKATSEETGGSVGLLEATTPRGPGRLAIFTTVATNFSTFSRESFFS